MSEDRNPRQIKDRLLRHTTLLSGFIIQLGLCEPREEGKNIGLIKREIQTILKELSLLNGYYIDTTKDEIMILIGLGSDLSQPSRKSDLILLTENFNDWVSRINSLKLEKPMIIDQELEQKFKLLNDRYNENISLLKALKYVRKKLMYSSVGIFAVFSILDVFGIDFNIFGFTLTDNIIFVFGITLFILGIISDKTYEWMNEKRKLTNEDLLFIYTVRLVNLLDGYMKNNISNNRKKATDLMEYIIEIVNTWNYGNLRLIKESFGNSIDSFKINLNRLILGVISRGSHQDLDILFKALSDFLKYMNDPSIMKLNEVNKLILQLPEIEFIKLNRMDGIKYWFYDNPNYLRFISAFVAIAIFNFIGIFYVKMNFYDLYGYTAAIFVAVLLGVDKILSLDKKIASMNEKRLRAGIT